MSSRSCFAFLLILSMAFLAAGADDKKEASYRGKTAREWAKQLKAAETAMRLEAAQALKQLGADAGAATPELAAALNDDNTAVREASLQALAAIGPDARAAVPALLEALKDRDFTYRDRVILALGTTGGGDERVGAALAGIVVAEWPAADDAPSVGIRPGPAPKFSAAGKALMQLGNNARGATKVLAPLVKRKNKYARLTAVQIVSKLGAEGVPILEQTILDSDYQIAKASADGLVALGPKAKEALPALRQALEKNQNPYLAAQVLAAIGEDGVPILVEGLKNTDPAVVRSAVTALRSRKGAKAAIPTLGALLNNPDVAVEAGRTLGTLGPDAVPVLSAALRHDRTARAALEGLALMGPEAREAIPALIERMKTKETQRPWSGMVLEKMGAVAIPALVEAFKDPDCDRAPGVLIAMSRRNPQIARQVIPPALKSMDEVKPIARMRALQVFGDVGADAEDGELLKKVIAAVRAGQKDPDADVRKFAAVAAQNLQRRGIKVSE